MKFKRTRLWWTRAQVLPLALAVLLGLSLWTAALMGIGYAVLT